MWSCSSRLSLVLCCICPLVLLGFNTLQKDVAWHKKNKLFLFTFI